MRGKETRIPQFYDVLDEEVVIVRSIYERLLKKAVQMGFMEIETSAIELRERYLNATGIHFSKIFEVRRPKEGNQFALQADLAMGMSRFVSDLPNAIPMLKLIQLEKLYRDRVDNKPGYRREFKQILLGEWETESFFSDAELIFLSYYGLKSIPKSEVLYIEISNQAIFNIIKEGLAEKIRFDGIEELKNVSICDEDKKALVEFYRKGLITCAELEYLLKILKDVNIKSEIKKMLEVYYYLLKEFDIKDEIYFNINNLEGTGHYSGLHYRIYMEIQGQKYLIGDGGRIDTLCNKFNSSKTIPAVCMGIGIQVLAQVLPEENQEKIAILIDDKNIRDNWELIKKIEKVLNEFSISIIPKEPGKKKKFFKSEFYKEYSFILIHGNRVEVRSNNYEFKKLINERIKEI